MKRSAKILSMLLLGILLTLPAYAQTGQGLISGKVTGRDGMPAPNVQVQIQRMNSLNANQRIVAQVFDTKSGRNGSYSQNGLPPGSYQVLVIENGKITLTMGDKPGDIITIADGREASVNLDLRKALEAPAAGAAGATNAPPPTAADLANDRKAMEAAAANKKTRDAAFKAGTDAYKAAAAAEPNAKDDAAKAEVTKGYEEAAKQFQVVVVADPKQDVAFANLGNALNKLKKCDEAAAAYQKAIVLKPMEAAYFNNLGLALGCAKKMDEAKTAFETAATMDPTKAGDYLFNQGAMFFNSADYPKALDAFAKTLKADPNNKAAMFQMAISYFATPETMAQAEPLLTKFLTLNPSPADAATAKAFLEAIHTSAPTEFKSDKALAEEKAKAAKDAQKGKAPAAGKSTK